MRGCQIGQGSLVASEFWTGQCHARGGDKLLALSDAGDLVLINPTPEKYTDLHALTRLMENVGPRQALQMGACMCGSVKEGACYEVGSRLSLR
jgi:hypothetical protein